MDYLDKLDQIVDKLDARFPNGNTPIQAISRLCEESGELAKEVNHFESMGIKEEKYGDPDKAKLVKEVQDVLRCALQIAKYYGVRKELRDSIDSDLNR